MPLLGLISDLYNLSDDFFCCLWILDGLPLLNLKVLHAIHADLMVIFRFWQVVQFGLAVVAVKNAHSQAIARKDSNLLVT